jgi:hypothetical protein
MKVGNLVKIKKIGYGLPPRLENSIGIVTRLLPQCHDRSQVYWPSANLKTRPQNAVLKIVSEHKGD